MIVGMFDETAFSLARRESMKNAYTLRNMGELEPARLNDEDTEYTTIQQVLEKLGKRFKSLKMTNKSGGHMRQGS